MTLLIQRAVEHELRDVQKLCAADDEVAVAVATACNFGKLLGFESEGPPLRAEQSGPKNRDSARTPPPPAKKHVTPTSALLLPQRPRLVPLFPPPESRS